MWFEVDFLKWTKIIGIKTQGRADNFELVQTYTVSYGADRNNFAHVKENNQIKVRKIMINHCNFINIATTTKMTFVLYAQNDRPFVLLNYFIADISFNRTPNSGPVLIISFIEYW